jgi:hypothetical protein
MRPNRFFACAMLHPRLALVCALALPTLATAEEAPAKRRAISAHMAEVLAAKLPPYDPTKREAPKPAESSPVLTDTAPTDPNIVQLPKVIINEGRLPTPEEILTEAALAEIAMNRYLGSKDGLDRGFLNRFTIAQFWQKVPILGKIAPGLFGVTNEQRAMSLYRIDQQLRKKQNMLDLGSMLGTSDPALGKQIKRDTRRMIGPQ